MKKFGLPLLIVFFLIAGLIPILMGGCSPDALENETVVEISAKWADSAHADAESVSFTLWDDEAFPEVPVDCAKCHSAHGYLDFLGEDGSNPGTVDAAAPLGTTVTCNVCHNPTAHEKDSAMFPSGAELSNLGQSANCIECHQGRTAGVDVKEAVTDIGDDEVSTNLRFINTHYKIAGATRFGSRVSIGYEYPGKEYYGFYDHIVDYQYCYECHDPHSLSVRVKDCGVCHSNVVASVDQLRDIRSDGTPDYDGDGDTSEGIYDELIGVHKLFYEAIKAYSQEVLDAPIIYKNSSPFWFIDSNNNGEADEDEINRENQFTSWSPRLLKAAYNYHLVIEDPGGYMHNSRYLIQLMVDGIENLGGDVSQLSRPEK